MATTLATILIQCLLIRAGGTKIDLFGKPYHFKPEEKDKDKAEAPHVCAIPVEDAAAIHRLLSIKGYQLVDPDAELPPKPKADKGQTIGNEKVDSKAVKPIIITCGDNEITLTDLTPEDLRKLAKDEFGIAVHHKWNDQTVIAKIIEKTRGE